MLYFTTQNLPGGKEGGGGLEECEQGNAGDASSRWIVRMPRDARFLARYDIAFAGQERGTKQ